MFIYALEIEGNLWACGKLHDHYANENLTMNEKKEGRALLYEKVVIPKLYK
jgi:hypothetical protein